MSKRVIERKVREEQEATAHAFQEFIETFQSSAVPHCKTFVKSGVLHPQTGLDEQEKGELYVLKPTLIHNDSSTIKNAIECARLLKNNKIERTRNTAKPKSNLEILKEELKLRHSARDDKSKLKECSVNYWNEVETGDPDTTNIFIANLNQKVTENDLMQLFGAFGPLASVKIMWPRGDEKNRNSNCGFVAFMSRKDGERALAALKCREDMRLRWGKSVEIPPTPIYIPPELLKLHLPPPHTGLPFNAQPFYRNYKEPQSDDEMRKLLFNSAIKVTIPLNKRIVMLVHRMVEFVAREGPSFEAIIMNREIQNPSYRFLFDNQSPIHTYYRWKLYSVLQGESQKNWSQKMFRMFDGGSIWISPPVHDYTEGMPIDLILQSSAGESESEATNKTSLSDSQHARLLHCLQNMTTHRDSVAEAMAFCFNHQEASADVISLLVDSMRNVKTKPTKKIARIYLISDILYNSRLKKSAQHFHAEIKQHLVEIFEHLRETHANITRYADKEEYKWRLQKVLKSWDIYNIYTGDFLNKLEHILFLKENFENDEDSSSADEPLDGARLIKISSKGDTLDECTTKKRRKDPDFSAFAPSRWERVDPEEVEAQAMSTQKFHDLEKHRLIIEEKSSNKQLLTEYERRKLRRIEVMVIQYHEELESGTKKLKRGTNVDEELANYRQRLMKKFKGEDANDDSVSSDEEYRRERKSRRERRRRNSKDRTNRQHKRHATRK